MAQFTPVGAEFVALFCAASLHGIYTVIFFAAIYLLWRRKDIPLTWMGITIRILTVIMYLISTAHIALSMNLNYDAFIVNADADRIFDHQGGGYIVVQLSIALVNCIFADIILIWRAWALCDRNYMAVIPLCVTLIGTAITGSFLVHNISGKIVHFNDIFSPSVSNWAFAMGALIFLTNAVATSVISARIWYHRRMLQKSGLSMLTGKYLTIILVLAESGAIYLTACILFVIFAAINHPAVVIIVDCVAQLTGIVPTLIIVLVSMRVDTESQTFRATAFVLTSCTGTGNTLPYSRRGNGSEEAVPI